MSCEQYKQVIVEAAATGEAGAVLQAHLDECRPCQAAFFDERHLFSVIDAGVSRAVNQPLSAEFLPRVRAAVELENSAGTFNARQFWYTMWPIAVTVIAVCAALLAVGHFRSSSVALKEPTPAAAVLRESAAPDLPVPAVKPATESATARNSPTRKLVGNRESRAIAAQEPAVAEVLVPSDEREALAHFVAGLPARREVAIALARPAPFEPPPDAAASGTLEIAKLEVKPLRPVEEK